MADELVFYLEQALDGRSHINDTVTPEQILELTGFGIKFSIQSEVFWGMMYVSLLANINEMSVSDLL